MNKKLDRILKKSKKLFVDYNSKLVIMSDCHRGSGNNYDNFIKNQNVFKSALQYYYKRGFIYIELGDGDDMWEVKNYEDIVEFHFDSFKQLRKFNDFNRLIMICGNHDIEKKSSAILEKYFYKYYDKKTKQYESLLEGLVVEESLVLNYKDHDIFLIHGHQVDFLNSTLWRFSRFFVRYGWKTIEHIGIKDPTNNIKFYNIKKRVEKKLYDWSEKNNVIIISGHTHRCVFPKIGKSLYFNAGSCIYTDGITALEIENGKISLVKWQFKINKGNLFSVERKVLEGPEKIDAFFL